MKTQKRVEYDCGVSDDKNIKESTAKGARPRGVGKRFEPGKSGNPGGQPKTPAEIRAVARLYSLEAVETLRDLMRSGNQVVRLKAAKELLDRGCGYPSQSLAGSDAEPYDLSDKRADIAHAVAGLAAAIEAARDPSGPK